MVVVNDDRLGHISLPALPEPDYETSEEDDDSLLLQKGGQDQDAYAILGLDVNASTAEVQSAYRRLVKRYHPDRASASCYDKEKFYRITTAGQVLRDRYHRLLYDIQHQKRYVSECEIHEVISQLRLRAITIVTNMTETVNSRRSTECQRDGLIIVKALYGDLKHRGALDRLPGGCIDVTVPVQCMVHSSELVDHSKTKMFLDGFYDPCPNEPDKQLFIRYIFQKVLHQICYSDADEVRVPMRSHSVSRIDIKEHHLYSTSITFPTRKSAIQRRNRLQELTHKKRLRTLRYAGISLVFVIATSLLVKSRWSPSKLDRNTVKSM